MKLGAFLRKIFQNIDGFKMLYIIYYVIICSTVINVYYYSSSTFRDYFIILPSFSLCHVKTAVIIKCAARNS